MKKTIALCLMSAAVFLPMKSSAEEKKLSPLEQAKMDMREADIKAYDTNKDGVLEADELKASAATKFDAADSNHDGVISQEEAAATTGKFEKDNAQTHGDAVSKNLGTRMKSRYKMSDTNHDGVVSKDEYESYMNGRQENFDRDGDGKISPEEYRMDGEKVPSSYMRPSK